MASKKGKEKEKAAPNTASVAKPASETNEEPNTPSPITKKKKSELLKMTTADTERVKEALKAKIHGEPSKDVSAPTPPLHQSSK